MSGLVFDFATLALADRYKLLTGLVVPRPIALVTTESADGIVNAAPYSFFNVFSHNPALVVLGIEHRPEGGPKDTVHNITTTREFVVNLVDEAIADGMNVCAVDFPAGESELPAAGFTTAPSSRVRPARIAEAPAALECRLFVALDPGMGRSLVIGEVLAIQTRDGIVDPDNLRVRLENYRPVGRLFGNLYCRTDNRFTLVRQSVAEWRAANDDGPGAA